MPRVLVIVSTLTVLAASAAAWWIGRHAESPQERYDIRREGVLRVGDPAPDVTLGTLDGGETRLSAHLRGRPLVLIFGSYT